VSTPRAALTPLDGTYHSTTNRHYYDRASCTFKPTTTQDLTPVVPTLSATICGPTGSGATWAG
jgi:hypothetical protein